VPVLLKSGFSRKKMKIVAARQNELLRETFAVDVSLYDLRKYVVMDNTSTVICTRNSL